MNTYSKLFAAIVLFFCLTLTAFGQTPESSETSPAAIPPAAKAQIVSKILTWYFKPQSRKKVVTISNDDVEAAWLPKIKGVEFRLISEAEAHETNEKVYVFRFTELDDLKGNWREIGFGFGAFGDGFMGDTWAFRLANRKLSLFKKNDGGWGSSGTDYGDETDK